jgi:hypothetical protein
MSFSISKWNKNGFSIYSIRFLVLTVQHKFGIGQYWIYAMVEVRLQVDRLVFQIDWSFVVWTWWIGWKSDYFVLASNEGSMKIWNVCLQPMSLPLTSALLNKNGCWIQNGRKGKFCCAIYNTLYFIYFVLLINKMYLLYQVPPPELV